MNPKQRRLVTSLLSLTAALPLILLGAVVGPGAAVADPGRAAAADPPPWAGGPGGNVRSGWEDRLEIHRGGVQEAIDRTAEQMWDREATVTSRALMSVVASELRDHEDPEAAWEVLRLVFDHQNMDPTAEDYGMFTQNLWGNCWYGLSCYQLAVAPYTRTTAGSSASISQTADVTPGSHVLTARLRTTYLYASQNYHFLQALVNGQVVWQEDVTTTDESWREISVDVTDAVGDAGEATVEFRLLENRGVAQLPVSIHFDQIGLSGSDLVGDVDEPGVWTESTTGEGVTVGLTRNGSTDINSTSFTLLMLAGILNSDDVQLFTAAQRDEIEERVRAASYFTVDEPHAQLGYTNARLLRDIQMILVGQAIGDDVLYQQGLDYWRAWVDYTREHGIREYGSPVYYGIDLGALMMGHSYVTDDDLRSELAQVLDLFWYDIAANYFPGRESLSGSHSRDYDFTHGTGPVSYFLTIEGWQSMPLPVAYTTFNYQVIQSYYGEHVYHPDHRMYALAVAPVKEVTARTDANAFLDRYNYVTPRWALGSTSETFTNVIPGAGGPTPYDKPINLELAGDRTTGTISIVPSWNTDP
ncbi:hypothetical protein [Georgenia subflava]|uniref:Uncharacterized protein n=1 Tax=Georgenia subflava TaxID=1622177 RepID=A0A6N7ELJ2_9MICO|nr:hypothetical protein [Georgenia subflava]MPV37968.1 hypothetical protein [Georgenia subflava]